MLQKHLSSVKDEEVRYRAMDRVEMLKQFLEQNPGDSFARYGLAMEYSRAGQTQTALEEFKKIVTSDADYVPAYQMAAQMLAEHDRADEAREWFQKGLEAASRTGNAKAQSEMQGLLDELG